jgi:uncharacterized OB-fold protein
MKLIACPECGAQVSSLATDCPKCAAPIKKIVVAESHGQPLPAATEATPTFSYAKLPKWIIWVVIGGVILVLLFIATNNRDQDSAQQQAPPGLQSGRSQYQL